MSDKNADILPLVVSDGHYLSLGVVGSVYSDIRQAERELARNGYVLGILRDSDPKQYGWFSVLAYDPQEIIHGAELWDADYSLPAPSVKEFVS